MFSRFVIAGTAVVAQAGIWVVSQHIPPFNATRVLIWLLVVRRHLVRSVFS